MQRLVPALPLALCLSVSPALAQPAQEIEFAMEILGALQDNSFAANREYCGMIGLDETDRLVASTPRKGRRDSCLSHDPRNAVRLVASYHTHGGFDGDADSEVPSPDDILGSIEEGLRGYVATPGGRLWLVDGQTGTARQICAGCLPVDSAFIPEPAGSVLDSYTLEQLQARQ